MKSNKVIIAIAAVSLFAAVPMGVMADEKKHDQHEQTEKSDKAAKPYPLDKCVVSDEKLGEHGKPYVFTHEGQEVKLCCKSCLKDFKKDPAKYMKKIEGAKKKKSS